MNTRKHSMFYKVFAGALIGVAALGVALAARAATQTDIVGPAGSGAFGQQVKVLPNGNIVVTDPGYDAPGPIADVGAVYLYDGGTGAQISRLTGSQAGDQVGSGGVVTLTNGNYLVLSPNWANGAVSAAGAVTWGNGMTGVTGVVGAANSLVGGKANDQVGYDVTALSNGNYLVRSPGWDNGAVTDAGAATWGNGTTGIMGAVSAANSLVGSTANDRVGDNQPGYPGVLVLNNGNYVVLSPYWDKGAVTDAGAVTWGNGMTGFTGVVGLANSLVGSTAWDRVGYHGVTALSNGNYVVRSLNWDNGAATGAGAVTWGNGTTGITGVVGAANSLVGGAASDRVGERGVLALSNGNYVVLSPSWANGAATKAGAVTWGNGTTGVTGVVSLANSLVGSKANDQVGGNQSDYPGALALNNGNYLVLSPYWANGAASAAGAVTWGNGTMGITGVVSIPNSLVGSRAWDRVGLDGATALINGSYVVLSPWWDNGAAADAGAATWGDGKTGITGAVSAANSLVGMGGDRVSDHGVTALSNGNYVVCSSRADGSGAATWGNGTTGITGVVSASNSLVGSLDTDWVGEYVTALSNGNYVVLSYNWTNGAEIEAGAATWGNGTTGITGAVSVANSLVGGTAFSFVGSGATALSNGNYVVHSPSWNGVGAVTWGNGTTGITGVVGVANSLVGSTADDLVGYPGATALSNGNYVVHSASWDNGAVERAGAVTLGRDGGGTVGPISGDNSVRGTAANGGWNLNFGYDGTRGQLVVGRPADNIVTLFTVIHRVYLPIMLRP